MKALFLALALIGPGTIDGGHETPVEFLGLPADKVASVLALPAPERALGERLFFDPMLSEDRSVSCSSCHLPEHGFADDKALSVGIRGQKTLRNSPTIVNRALGKQFMWDGRADTLEEQVLQPIENELEMGLPLAQAIARLAQEPSYVRDFEAVFGAAPDSELMARALATFVRAQLRGGSPVDRFRAGARDALTPAERGGLWFFESRGGCWRCHSGANFSDEGFHNTGVASAAGARGDEDAGRFAVTHERADTGAFKTPTLRGLVDTAPYMHDGSQDTLAAVVEFYRQGGHANEHLDEVLAPIEMTDADAANLIAFLRALSAD
ncbi:MAG: cytochrome c peroxidase [Chlamydiales bacterium]|jgi:cytochrome c peroxidase